MNKEIKIYGTSIKIGNNGYINQPKEIIEYIKQLQEKLDKINKYLDGHDYDYVYMDCKFIETKQFKDIQKIINEEE